MSDFIDETLILALGDFEIVRYDLLIKITNYFTIQKEQTTTSFLLALSK